MSEYEWPNGETAFVRELRAALSLRDLDIGDAIGVSRPTIQAWASGRLPERMTAAQLASLQALADTLATRLRNLASAMSFAEASTEAPTRKNTRGSAWYDYRTFDKIDHCVYFLIDGDRVKIGKTKKPTSRERSYKTAGLFQGFTATTPGYTEKEAAYHRAFASDRIEGEWFRLTPRIQAEIDSILALALM